jgi:hypothetical protein
MAGFLFKNYFKKHILCPCAKNNSTQVFKEAIILQDGRFSLHASTHLPCKTKHL